LKGEKELPMAEARSHGISDPHATLIEAEALMRKQAWEEVAALGLRLPTPPDESWLAVMDVVAFALGQLRQWTVAIALLEHAYGLEATWRRASSLAYLYYDGALASQAPRGPKPDMSKEALRKGFRRWIAEALRHDPDSIKDIYRLGIFEAQVEACHDKPALRAFLRVIDLFHALSEEEKARRGDYRKVCSKALYAGARSALRLKQLGLARKLSFACIREDKEANHVEPVHKLQMAARVCMATGEFDHAERAARLALDAPGPPRRDYLFGLLSDISLLRSDPEAACSWIEKHVPEHRRASYLWRKLGDGRAARGQLKEACQAWESALRQDRCGRHLTLVRLGRAYLDLGALGKAEDAFRKAAHFRVSRFMKEDREALEGLEKVLALRGKKEELPRIAERLAKCGGQGQPASDDDELGVA
jgi:tetratricopeptide (TPR) repeat protein